MNWHALMAFARYICGGKCVEEKQIMSLALSPDCYAPGIDDQGVYDDSMPAKFPEVGIVCPCYMRRYASREKFAQHLRCAHHKQWVRELTANSKNYFRKYIEQEQIIRQQRLLIAELEKKLIVPKVDDLLM